MVPWGWSVTEPTTASSETTAIHSMIFGGPPPPRGCVVIGLGDGVCGFRFFPPPGFLA
jgi:hypothetical protein